MCLSQQSLPPFPFYLRESGESIFVNSHQADSIILKSTSHILEQLVQYGIDLGLVNF